MLQNSIEQILHYGKTFYIGFMPNLAGYQTRLQLVVSAEGSLPVQFGVETSSGVLYTGTTTASQSVQSLSTFLLVLSLTMLPILTATKEFMCTLLDKEPYQYWLLTVNLR